MNEWPNNNISGAFISSVRSDQEVHLNRANINVSFISYNIRGTSFVDACVTAPGVVNHGRCCPYVAHSGRPHLPKITTNKAFECFTNIYLYLLLNTYLDI
jgi:hypothetical protein